MTTAPPPALRVRGIRKSYAGNEVLHGIDLDVAPGEIHAVLGENGAGKSTLMKIIAGIATPDAGTVEVDGLPIGHSIREARASGVFLVHQELSLVPTLSVGENVFLGVQPAVGGVVRRREMHAKARDALAVVGLQVDARTPVERLSFAERQLVEITRAVVESPRILILDEPTSALSPAEAGSLIELLRGLVAGGTTILYITHRLAEVRELCSRASVLRDGELVARHDLAEVDQDTLVHSLVGRQLDLLARREPTPESELGDVIIATDELAGPGVAGVSLRVRAGEICGLGGLVGAGRTEFARLLAGLEKPRSGTMSYCGRAYTERSASRARDLRIGYVPEDRQREGLALDLTAGENAVVPSLRHLRTALGFVRRRRADELAKDILARTKVHPPDPRYLVRSLSGGNQQKIVIGKWLPLSPQLLILDEPTRGVDVGAKSELHGQMDSLARAGTAILLISSDLPELLSVADRILVMRDGKISGEVTRERWSEQDVMRLATTHAAHGDEHRRETP